MLKPPNAGEDAPQVMLHDLIGVQFVSSLTRLAMSAWSVIRPGIRKEAILALQVQASSQLLPHHRIQTIPQRDDLVFHR